MIRAKNYETVSKFVKVMTKILRPLFFPDTVYMTTLTSTPQTDRQTDNISVKIVKKSRSTR